MAPFLASAVEQAVPLGRLRAGRPGAAAALAVHSGVEGSEQASCLLVLRKALPRGLFFFRLIVSSGFLSCHVPGRLFAWGRSVCPPLKQLFAHLLGFEEE